MQNLENKVAVITGAASGVGKQLALRLARAGAKIVLADIEANALDQAVQDVRGVGGDAIGQLTDVSKRDQIDALRDRAVDQFGRVHLLFNNAGVSGGGPSIWETPEKAYRWLMEVNYFGPLNGILSFMPLLIQQDEEALITSTASGAGLIFPPTSPGYSASKAALIALMEVLAQQLQMAGSKVKAAILFPGPHVVDSGLFNSQRNVQSEYREAVSAASGGVTNVAEFQAVMQQLLGRSVDLTSPDEFAEEVYQSILRDEFYILPLTSKAQAAIRERCEIMLSRGQPVIPDML